MQNGEKYTELAVQSTPTDVISCTAIIAMKMMMVMMVTDESHAVARS